jgi:uncharacterized protein YndB with AHSA1/START domain
MTAAEGTFVRHTMSVDAPQEKAFEVFTDSLDDWWPRSHKIGAEPLERAVLEAGEGGRWYERDTDGSECDWGKVLVWEPPSRVVLTWQLTGEWAYDADFVTEIEVTFVPEGPNRTRVEVEHRGLDAYGDQAGDMREQFDSPGGWPGLLEAFAAAAAA